ncbi:MAG: hypothetical protein HYU64_20795 [Armatimonadetes bacterium]|nr:hypothetical protein [Armatimonadota bacterium]
MQNSNPAVVGSPNPLVTALRWLAFISGGILGGGLAWGLAFLAFGSSSWHRGDAI